MTNQTFIQYFHWYLPNEINLWNFFKKETKRLAALGVTSAWLPPPCKGGAGKSSVGYDIYDLFDIGEFDQQGTIPTKYGSREEYVAAIKAAHENKICVLADIPFNHKAHGDETEKIMVREVNPDNRVEFISQPMEIEAWTKFTFPNRQKKYSEFIWDHHCFSGVDWAEDKKKTGIFKILNEYGDTWEDLAEKEFGNFDYLVFSDIEFRNRSVREELKYWGKWFLEATDIDGFRLDAIKHISPSFIMEWIDHMNSVCNKPMFYMGEYWNDQNAESLKKYVDLTQGRVQLVDAPLHHNFYTASRSGAGYDLRNILHDSLLATNPELAITFVDNHDLQPLQKLEAPVEEVFKSLAYALIMLREQGIPCIFYPDLYGAKYTDKDKQGNEQHITLNPIKELPMMMLLRKELAYGMQRDYFDYPNTIGWTREGVDDLPGSGIAVVMSNGSDGWKNMEMGKKFAGKIFRDAFQHCKEDVTLDKNGFADFSCKANRVSAWVLISSLEKINAHSSQILSSVPIPGQ